MGSSHIKVVGLDGQSGEGVAQMSGVTRVTDSQTITQNLIIIFYSRRIFFIVGTTKIFCSGINLIELHMWSDLLDQFRSKT